VFLRWISLKDFSEVGKCVTRHGHSQPDHWKLNLSLTDLMIEWTGSDQMLEHPAQKQVVLLLLRSLLELSLACLRTLTSSLCCSCSVNVTGAVCCSAWKCSSGRFLFVSVIVVSSDSILQTPEWMALKRASVWMMSAFRHFSCWFGLRCTRNCRFPLVAQTS